MEKLAWMIYKNFYADKQMQMQIKEAIDTFHGRKVSKIDPVHAISFCDEKNEECEACLLQRCPRIWKIRQHNRKSGRDDYNYNNLQTITWVLLDEHNHPWQIK